MPSFPDLASSLPPAAEEAIELRTRDEKRFNRPDGTVTAVFGQNLHYEAAPGQWEDVDHNFRPSGNEQVMDLSDAVVTVATGGLSVVGRKTGRGILWRTPAMPEVSGSSATYRDQGLEWRYTTTATGVKLTASVGSRRGPQTYQFPYQLIGTSSKELGINDHGDIVGDGLLVPKAVVVDAKDAQASAGSGVAWR